MGKATKGKAKPVKTQKPKKIVYFMGNSRPLCMFNALKNLFVDEGKIIDGSWHCGLTKW
jgi:hypothetical protein